MYSKSQMPYIKEALTFFLACVFLVVTNNVPAPAENAASSNPANNANAATGATTQTVAGALQQTRAQAQNAYHATQFESAAQQYQNICRSPAHDGNDLYWLGESYFHLGYFVQAAQSFQQALVLNPRADILQVRIVQSYLAGKQPQAAKAKIAAALNVVTDPIVRQQLSALSRYCDNPPAFHINNITHLPPGARVAEK